MNFPRLLNLNPTRFLVIGFLLALIAPFTSLADPVYYIVFEEDAAGRPEPVFIRVVEMPTVPRSYSDPELQKAQQRSLEGDPVHIVKLENAEGKAVHQTVVEVPRWIRGEFRGDPLPSGAFEIDAHRFRAERPAFVARVPVIAGSRLVLDAPQRATFDLDKLAAEAASLPLASYATQGTAATREATGPSANRMDLVLMGDGYTAAQQATFEADAANLENDFLGIAPYAEYRNLLNVTPLFTPSTESGADHPPYNASCSGDNPSCCADTLMLSDPLAGTFVDTALGARFCSFQIYRLLVVDSSAVFAAASAVPTWDHILVFVNDTTYGGSGGTFAVASKAPQAVQLAQHEFGHSFTELADEYDTPYPGFPTCSDVSAPACEANATDETNASLIKWAPWILPTTPIPTPETATYSSVVGLFEGARYFSSGMYRPWHQCLMKDFGTTEFGPICTQEYVRHLYRGGWGTPATGIDLIEPGMEVPPIGPPIEGSESIDFSVVLLQPVGAPALDVQWYVDGILQAGASDSNSFTFAPTGGPGPYTVEVRVEDVTPFVHPDMAGDLLKSSRSWTASFVAMAVTNTSDSGAGSLRQAISDAGPGEVIVFDPGLSGQTITLASQLLIDEDITIDASDLPDGLILDGNNASRVLQIGQISGGRTVSLKGLTLSGGNFDYGGAIRNNQSDLTLTDCTVTGNQATVQGGGIYNYFASLTLENVTLSNNQSLGNGGGMWSAGGSFRFENVTVAGNSAQNYAGVVNENGSATVVHSTFSGNVAAGTGGGFSHLEFGAANLTIENTISAGNTAGTGADVYRNSGTFTPTGANLVGNNDTVTTEFPADGVLVGGSGFPLVDPLLGVLGNSGGPTNTVPPLLGSPAIDAAIATANSPVTDQRGTPRPGGLDNDLGAVELAACGNGVIGTGEECDDGNTADGDCCSALCGFDPVGTACDFDGNACTLDTCDGASTCSAGAQLDCNDGNVCTDDSCDPASGCVNNPNVAPCEDGNVCTTDDTCSGGTCQSGLPPTAPDAIYALTLADNQVDWPLLPGADAYDLVRGDIGLLRSSGGDFASATTVCQANDSVQTSLIDSTVPAAGSGFYYLARGINCSGPGSYDSIGAGQASSRDSEIEAASMTCSSTCAHETCETGVALDPWCGGECVAAICAVDPFCCANSWDATCVSEVSTVCGSDSGNAVGQWTGIVDQFDGSTLIYQFVVDANVTSCAEIGSVIGTVDYPDFGCGGNWVLQSRNGPTFVVEEQLTYGQASCVDLCAIDLTYEAGSETLEYHVLVGGCPTFPTTTSDGILGRAAKTGL